MMGVMGYVSNISRDKFRFHERNNNIYTNRINRLSQVNICARYLAVIIGLFFSFDVLALTIVDGDSVEASLDCTSSPCPWGESLSRQAVAWPDTVNTVNQRLGYTTSHPIYLPADRANGATITILSGSASLRAGQPDADYHATLAELSIGDSFSVSGLVAGEVLLISSLSNFSYLVDLQENNDTVPGDPEPLQGTSSEFVTLSCTSSPCPWGAAPGSNAVVWPDTSGTVTNRLGYTANESVYLESNFANGTVITIYSGSASLSAGNPNDASFRSLGTLSAGQSMTVSGIINGEVLAVLNNSSTFTYDAVLGEPTSDPTTPDDGTTDPGTPGTSEFVSLICTGNKCPWGVTPGANAVVWPQESMPVTRRVGYTANEGIYLPSAYANGATVTISSGSAKITAGYSNAEYFRSLASLNTGETYTIGGLRPGEVVLVSHSNNFSFEYTLPPPPAEAVGDIYSSVATYWRCTTADCWSGDWVGSTVVWPSWSAYSDNARTGNNLRTTFGEDGGLIYPYTGAWADGCKFTGVSGIVAIVEWKRGADDWSTSYIGPGDSYTINLFDTQDSVLLEGLGSFNVAVNNCTPQILP
jgi:hypothetical protein